MKTCTKCKEIKVLAEFYPDKYNGISASCKECEKQRRRNRYKNHKVRELENVRRWQAANYERFMAKQREYQQKIRKIA